MAKTRSSPRTRRHLALGLALPMVFATSLSPAAADDYQDWLRSQSHGANEIKQQFQTYRSEQDQEFTRHLKQQWQEFQVFRGKVRDPKPKPKVIPKAPVVAKVPPPDIPRVPAVPVVKPAPPIVEPALPKVEPRPPRIEPPPPLVKPPEIARDSIELDFYGNPLSLPYDPQWRNARAQTLNSAGLAAFWDMMSATRHAPTLQAVARARAEMRLDDWGHAALWQEVARTLQPNRPTEQNLLLWYFLVKAGVDVRLGYSGQQVYLFVAVKQPVYAASFIKLGKSTYYALMSADRGKSLRTFSTYEANYPAPLTPLDLKGAATAFTQASPVEKNVAFDYQGRTVNLKVAYDRRLVQYMAGFPQMDFDLYFSTQASPSAREPLLHALRQHVQGMREEDAVNFLLAFVQKGFAYKTDEEQFGYEKYFFVEEAFHYPYSDCEDRSALFSWLVRELLGIKTVGLHYPGHMTTAVAIKGPQANRAANKWATVEWQGERYVIADPTYINAGVGMPMPSYAELQPLRVIPAQ